ncbi:MAG: hypothetical protein IJ721_03390 [Bacteroidales bacterium]|nr:hypothetical protein [Bacteroidales bacterium]
MKLNRILLISSLSVIVWNCSRLDEGVVCSEVTDDMISDVETRSGLASDTVFSFPDVDWASFKSYQEKVDVCQIPEDQLAAMATDDLVRLCLDYPLLLDAYAFNSIEEGLTTVLSRFNGFKELVSRKDVYPATCRTLLTKVRKDSVGPLSEREEIDRAFHLALWERILSMEPVRSQRTEDDSLLEQELEELIQKEHGDMKGQGVSSAQVKSMASAPYPDTTLYTPNGTKVQDVYVRPEEYTVAEQEYWEEYLLNHYSGITILAPATSTYNCHYYAWSGRENHDAWLGYSTVTAEDVYWTDGSYVETSSTDVEATVASYVNGNHSAHVVDSTTFISKWGAGPLVKHNRYVSPYNASSLKYYKTCMNIGGSFSLSVPIPGMSTPPAGVPYYINNFPIGAHANWTIEPINYIVSGEGSQQIQAVIYESTWIGATVVTQHGISVPLYPRYIQMNFNPEYVYISGFQLFNTLPPPSPELLNPNPIFSATLGVLTNYPEADYTFAITSGSTSGMRIVSSAFQGDASFIDKVVRDVFFYSAGTYTIKVTGSNEYGSYSRNVTLYFDGTTAQII